MKIPRRLFPTLAAGLCLCLLLAYPQGVDSFAANDEVGIGADDGEDYADEEAEEEEDEEEDSSADYEDELDDLNAQLEQIQKEQEQIQAELDQITDEKAQAVAQRDQLSRQIELTRQEITLLNNRITLLEGDLAQKEEELDLKQEEIDENYELFKERQRAMYMTSDASVIGSVLGADSFWEFLTQNEMMSRIAEHDQALIDELTVEMEQIEAIKTTIEEDKAAVEASKEQMDAKQVTLNGQLGQVESQIQDIQAMEEEFLANKEAKQAEMAAVQAELDRIYELLAPDMDDEYVGGEFQWPLPGYYNITSYYGGRFGGADYHTGIDISGANVYGKDIVAANSGRVAFVNRTYSPGVGYGIYLMIDHGGGYTTLYAHTSEILVEVGDYVSRGQTIARVGSTGWSTGPHLHFEVRINGSHTNPLPYVQG